MSVSQVDPGIISKVEKTGDRLMSRVGYSNKERHDTLLSVVAYRYLLDCGGTIRWTSDSQENRVKGLRTMWEYVGYQCPLVNDDDSYERVVNPTDRDRYDSLDWSARKYNRGFRDLQDQLRKDHCIELFMLPGRVGSTRIEVITCDPNYVVVTDSDNPLTAHELAEKVYKKNFRGQVSAAVRKLVSLGINNPLEEIGRILSEAASAMVVTPKMLDVGSPD